MTVQILTEDQRYKLDREPDRVFYSEPRFVQHLDEGFRTRLTSFYREHIPSGAVVLDLGSSWVSHLPEEVHYERVIGHGMNEAELVANSRLDSHYVQDMNLDPTIPLKDASVDVCLAVAAWQYWTQPENVARKCFASRGPMAQRSLRSRIGCFLQRHHRFGLITTTNSISTTWAQCCKPMAGLTYGCLRKKQNPQG